MNAYQSINQGQRLMMICIDAMSLAFVKANREQLPVFSGLLQEGAAREINSAGVHMSASVWPTFAAGADPGAHGHYFPFQWNPHKMRFESTLVPDLEAQVRFEPFWRRLAREGIKTIVLDTGVLLDPSGSPCLEVVNWSAQSSGHTVSSDPETLKELHRRFGRRPIGKEVPVPKTLSQSRRIRDQMIEAVRRKTDAVLWLMERPDWRLFIAGFYEVHRAGHNLLAVEGDFGSATDADALLDVYKAQDREIGRLIDAAKDGRTTIALFALHSMAPNRAQDHFIDEMLARLNAAYLAKQGAAPVQRDAPNLMTRLRKRVPYRVQFALAKTLGEGVQDWVVNRSLVGGRDWSRTLSFRMLSGGEGYIRFNIKGRERKGYFEDGGAELERYRAWLKERLLEIKMTATGEPFLDAVVDADELFPGPRTQYLPDLVLKYAPDAPAHSIISPVIGEITGSLATGRGGNHTGAAFLMMTGAGARNAAAESVRDIKDLARFAETMLADSRSSVT
jgi:predicted AlkP superfamily phosphohydrolase/phosphomutase